MRMSQNGILGVSCIVFGGLLLLLWAPLDSATWYVVQMRGKYAIGDATAPAFAGAVFLLAGLMLVFGSERAGEPSPDRAGIIFLCKALAAVVAGMLIVRFAGPLAAGATGQEYRLLRDSAPWRFLGLAFGGSFTVSALIILAEGRFSWRAVVAGAGAVLLIIAIYDIPFEDLLLPPNGDV